MKTINNNTKQARHFVYEYMNSKRETLADCYERWSTHKQLAYINCIKQMRQENGIGFRILGSNSMQFTAAWICLNPNGANDLRIETRDNSYIIPNYEETLPF